MKFAKIGDTLIEVTLAVGIFSMVAIAVVAVVSGSTSSAQSALETTITREEIDAQAEALRFIQASYIAGGKANAAGNEWYTRLWNKITDLASTESATILDYQPNTCADLYNKDMSGNIIAEKAFIINTHKMYLLNSEKEGAGEDYDRVINQIVVQAGESNTYMSADAVPAFEGTVAFSAAGTYPRMIFGGDTESVYGAERGQDLTRVEGLYVVATRDDETTTIVNPNKDELNGGTGVVDYQAAAYYDFYIRTCWFNPGAERPSTISTVIRLYDPDVINY